MHVTTVGQLDAFQVMVRARTSSNSSTKPECISDQRVTACIPMVTYAVAVNNREPFNRYLRTTIWNAAVTDWSQLIPVVGDSDAGVNAGELVHRS